MGAKTLRGLAAAAMLMAGTLSVAQAEEDEKLLPLSASGDIGVVTKYIFRAQSALGNQAASVQGSLAVSPDILPQFSTGIWYSTINGQNGDEIDFTGDFTQEFGDASVSVGTVAYTFVDNSDATAVDVYGGAGYGPISTTLYYTAMGDETATVLGDDDIWWEISGEGPSLMGIVPSVTAQFARYGEETEGSASSNDDFQLVAIVPSLSKDITDSISMSINYSIATGEDRNDANINNEFWAGFFLSF